MKHNHHIAGVLCATLLAAGSTGFAQVKPSPERSLERPNRGQSSQTERAVPAPGDRKAEEYGKTSREGGKIQKASELTNVEVKTHEGEAVGRLTDLAIDLKSNKVLFAVVRLDSEASEQRRSSQSARQLGQAEANDRAGRPQSGIDRAARPAQPSLDENQEDSCIAVPIALLQRAPGQKAWIIRADKSAIDQAPRFSENHWPTTAGESWGASLKVQEDEASQIEPRRGQATEPGPRTRPNRDGVDR